MHLDARVLEYQLIKWSFYQRHPSNTIFSNGAKCKKSVAE